MNPTRKEFIYADLRVCYFEHIGDPSKKPLVFLHGWGADSTHWLPLMKHFAAKGHSVYSLDFPGFGCSENPPEEGWGIEEYRDLLLAFLEKKGIEHSLVITHSFGGRVVIKAVADNSELFEKIVFMGVPGIRLGKKKLSFMRVVAKLVKPFFALPFMSGVRARIYRVLGASDYLYRPELKTTFVKVINEDLEPLLSRVTAPTLLVWGREDNVIPLEVATHMNLALPRARLEVVDDAGHFVLSDQPERAQELIDSFIYSS